MVAIPVSVSWDFGVGLAYGGHLAMVPPAPAVVLSPAVEVPCTMKWPPGSLTGKNKLTSTVLCNGYSIVQDGHDCGEFIGQITFVQLNAFTPAIMALTSRTPLMSCFSVRMNGEKTACTYLLVPMVVCSTPVDVPFCPTVSNLTRSVNVGMSLADIIGGLVSYAASALIKKFMKNSGPWAQAFAKAAAGLASSAVQHAIDPRYPVSAQVKFNAFGGEVKVGVQGGSSDTANNPTQASASYERKAAGGAASGKASASYTQDAGGDASKEGADASAKGHVGDDEQGAGVHRGKDGTTTGTGAAAPAKPGDQGAWGEKT